MPTVQLYLQQKPITIDLIRYKHSTPTKYATALAKKLMESPQIPQVTRKKIDLTPFLISLINTRTLRITQCSHLVQ